jgi:hypothetical protein
MLMSRQEEIGKMESLTIELCPKLLARPSATSPNAEQTL